MIITLTDDAKTQLRSQFGQNPVRIFITDGCCGKSFGFEANAIKTETDMEVAADEVIFLADNEAENLAPEITISYPGPIDGFMVTNKKAVGGCACGRSFFIE